MSSDLAHRLSLHIRKRELMRAGDRVAVAVSGGADSVALLRLLLDLRSELGVVLSVAHFNHRIRGTASDEDEQFVRDLAGKHDLRFWYADADVPAYAREFKVSLEAAARRKRYEFFENIVTCGSAERIATAHTLDDQAETVLMRIIRGTGVSGLTGIHERVRIEEPGSGDEIGAIVRPLLPFRRPELETYLHSLNQTWREDATNADLHHTRNRIRQLVIPLLEREFNPAIRERLAELADIARGEENWWDENIRLLLCEAKSDEVSAIRNMGVGIGRRLIRALAQRHGISLDFQQTDKVWQMVHCGSPKVGEIREGIVAELTPTHLRFRPVDQPPALYKYRLTVLNEVAIPELAICIRTEFPIDARKHGAFDPSSVASVNVKKLDSLLLRPWRPGDRFWPQHSSGPKKVKELLTDKHITGPDRKLWPVIACGNDIVWLRGFGVSQPFTADDTATDAIVITERSIES